MASGLLITFEGVEGSGKTTQVELLAAHLRARSRVVRTVREPGGTTLGERIRALLLDPELRPTPLTELLLVEAARSQHVADVIAPALAAGEVVLSDRFADSSLAYQGSARGLGWDVVTTLNDLACGQVRPDRTLVLDLPLEAALRRARSRPSTTASNRRFEDEQEAFHRAVAEGFATLTAAEPGRVRRIDATGAAAEVHARVLDALEDLLP